MFLETITKARYGASGKLGNAFFSKRNKHGKVIIIGLSPQLFRQAVYLDK